MKDAVEALRNHGVIAFPTETVMGFGIAYDDEIAFKKLNIIKRRPENKPYSLMLGNTKDIEKYAEIDSVSQKIIDKFLPGPLTILLKKKNLPEHVTLGSEYVGIRVPDLKEITDVISKFGKPILAPSANRSGETPLSTSEEIRDEFKDELDYIIEGKAGNGLPSTIVKFDKELTILREGPISKEEILEAIKL